MREKSQKDLNKMKKIGIFILVMSVLFGIYAVIMSGKSNSNLVYDIQNHEDKVKEYNYSTDIKHPDPEMRSIFESSMWKSGIKENEWNDVTENQDDGDLEILEKPSEKDPFTEEQYRKFELIRKKMPGNSLIPKKMTPQERLADENKKMELHVIAGLIQNGEASPEEINQYYDTKVKEMRDRLQIMELARKRMDGIDENSEAKKQLVVTLNYLNTRLNTLESSRKTALENVNNN